MIYSYEVEQAECKMGVHSQGESGFFGSFDEDTEAQNDPLQFNEQVIDDELGKSFSCNPSSSMLLLNDF